MAFGILFLFNEGNVSILPIITTNAQFSVSRNKALYVYIEIRET